MLVLPAPSEAQAFIETWDQLASFVRRFPDGGVWGHWKSQMLLVLSMATQAGVAAHFRAGQSMQHLIFSAKSDHGLEDEPRVTLARVDEDKFEVSFGHADREFADAEEAEVVSGAEIYPTFVRFLARLWGEARPAVPIPDCLRP